VSDNVTLDLQSCTVAQKVERGLCCETSVQSSDDSNEVITIKTVGEVVSIKEEDEPIAISFSSIKDEPEVSPKAFQQYLGLPSVVMPLCLSVCLPFQVNQLRMVNGIVLNVFSDNVKYHG
jgi:hypothetical protein